MRWRRRIGRSIRWFVSLPLSLSHFVDHDTPGANANDGVQKVKNKLYEFQKLSATNDNFIPTLQSLWSDLEHHIQEEERDDLPALEQNIDESSSHDLATSFSRTKHFVPTHSHPSAPDKPPYETAAGMLATPIDKLIDMFKKFPSEEEKKKKKGAGKGSGGSAEVIG